MTIKPVNNQIMLQNKIEGKSTKKASSENQKDKLQISAEALKMNQDAKLSPALEEIRNKINNKFYDSDEVINKVAVQILKDIDNL
jgi:hypothetical protein